MPPSRRPALHRRRDPVLVDANTTHDACAAKLAALYQAAEDAGNLRRPHGGRRASLAVCDGRPRCPRLQGEADGPEDNQQRHTQRMPNKTKRTITITAENDYEIHRLAKLWGINVTKSESADITTSQPSSVATTSRYNIRQAEALEMLKVLRCRLPGLLMGPVMPWDTKAKAQRLQTVVGSPPLLCNHGRRGQTPPCACSDPSEEPCAAEPRRKDDRVRSARVVIYLL